MEAQVPVANFTANVTSGCGPLSVSFTDQSTGSPKFWNWDFGNGQLSNQQNPAISFAPGTYTVTLVVRNNDGINSITKTNYLTVNASPSVDFLADKTLTCLPAGIQFTDASVPNAGTIVKWEWNFGDGLNSNSGSQNPAHVYTTPGFYDIYLKVTSSTGCTGANSKGRYIRVVNGVKANFTTIGPATCKPPFAVTFQNQTSGPGNITYAWDLGNSVNSTQASPPNTYVTPGTYTIKLRAQSEFGCSDSIQKNIPINGIITDFSGPDTVCLGSPASFQSTTNPPPSKVLWTFGDGTSSSQFTPPPKTYTAAGIYAVKMVSSFTSCKDSVTKNITVFDKPAVDFYSANSVNCKPPHTVTFQNLSPDVVSAQWNFGDGSTANAAGGNVNHTYTTTGDFDVTLTITDSRGCSNTVVKKQYVHIQPPVAGIGGVPAGLCLGRAFTPVSNSGAYDVITSYTWDFGDATPTVTGATPSHVYAAVGTYNVKLTITTSGGCTASVTVPGAVKVGLPPNINFTVNSPTVCRSGYSVFTNLTTPATSTVVWDFNDGTTSTLFNPPPHKFNDTGFFSIKLKATNSGCEDSLTKFAMVRVAPPLANFGFTVDCVTRTNVTFTDSSINNPGTYGPLAYAWNFGDPVPTTSTAAAPVFNYPALGSYIVTLIVNNNVCYDTVYKKVQLINEKADFTISKSTVCRNETILYTPTNTPGYVKKYFWLLDGTIPVPDLPFLYSSFPSTGNHTVQLVITDINDCTDSSAVKTIKVTGPTASFKVARQGSCVKNAVNFIDSSVSTGTIIKWTFDFGDGIVKSFTAPPFTHAYTDTGSYSVKLTVNDNIGCQDTFRLPANILITKPSLSFSAANTVFCPNTPLQFTDSSFGTALQYTWNFGDGSTANVPNPIHTYAGNDSSYTVKLLVTDSAGCKDSLTKVGYVKIRAPKPTFTAKDTASLCPPLETKFSFTGKDYESFIWDFGDGGQSSLANTSHFYNTYGNYTAKLVVTGFGGCQDSASVNVRLTNPYANTSVAFDPKQACNELNVNFNIVTPFASSFAIGFGDGVIDTSRQTTLQHFYSLPNLYSPYIVLKDSIGCIVVIGGLGNIDIKGAVPLFGMDKKKFCDSGTVYFTDYSQDGLDKIVTKTWDFGDGVSGVTTKDAVHSYTRPGLFVTSQTVTTQAGCTKTLTDTVRVLATPQPIISSVDGICNDRIIDFTGSLLVPPDTAIVWKWDLGKGQTSPKQNVSVNYPDTGLHLITLEATNSLGCKGDTSKTIRVFPLPSISITGDTTFISGATGITIPITYSSNATTYNWTPAANLSCSDCPNPFASPKFTTTYNVKVTDANGCISSRNVTLLVTCNNKNFFIPNTFSPNNDGANDRFYPRGTGLDRIQALRIYNRWGELVFEKRNFAANDASAGWDGSYKGKTAATDTYIYMVDIICENANIITYKGNVTLIR
jgi:gliding motility-associated-like protein